VFISHAARDQGLARSVCAALEGAGIRCWMAPRDIPDGADWAAEIVSAIERSRALLLLLTEHANASRQVGREVGCADTRGVPLVPVRLAEVPLAGRLEFFVGDEQWIDALARPLEPVLDDLVARVRARLEAAPSAPPPAAAGAPAAPWRPPRERVLAQLAGDLAHYRDAAFRMQAAMSDSARVVARRGEANRLFVEAVEGYNEFGRGFMQRLPDYAASVRKYWGPEEARAFRELHEFVEGQVYRGRMFELNDVRVRLNDLSFGPRRPDPVYAQTDRLNAPALQAARDALAELTGRVDRFLDRLRERS
jgi:hypothetical protein